MDFDLCFYSGIRREVLVREERVGSIKTHKGILKAQEKRKESKTATFFYKRRENQEIKKTLERRKRRREERRELEGEEKEEREEEEEEDLEEWKFKIGKTGRRRNRMVRVKKKKQVEEEEKEEEEKGEEKKGEECVSCSQMKVRGMRGEVGGEGRVEGGGGRVEGGGGRVGGVKVKHSLCESCCAQLYEECKEHGSSSSSGGKLGQMGSLLKLYSFRSFRELGYVECQSLGVSLLSLQLFSLLYSQASLSFSLSLPLWPKFPLQLYSIGLELERSLSLRSSPNSSSSTSSSWSSPPILFSFPLLLFPSSSSPHLVCSSFTLFYSIQ